MSPRPRLGQHWLTDRHLLAEIVEAVDLKAQERVCEIGAGEGSLTAELVKTPAQVVALEYDKVLFQQLLVRFNPLPANLELIEADVRLFDWQKLPPDYKICANIPYYLTAYLLRLLVETPNQPQRAVLVIPEEIAQRLKATSRRSLLALIVQTSYGVQLGRKILAGSFQPPPKIDSRLIILTRQTTFTELDFKDQAHLLRLFKAAFAQPRKQLGTNLKNNLKLSKTDLDKIKSTVSFSLSLRPADLNNDQWWQLWLLLKPQLLKT